MLRVLLLLISLLVVGCVPAQTPPQLDYTPGAYVVVEPQVYDAGVFQVQYPGGWRIVKTSEAGAPMAVVFVGPDDDRFISVVEGDQGPPPPADGLQADHHTKTLSSGQTVTVSGYAPAAIWDDFAPILARVVESVE